jgi:hypothetical protein
MRRAAALALCAVCCQFDPAAIPDRGADGSHLPGDPDAASPPDAARPDADPPDAMPDVFTCPGDFVAVDLGCYRVTIDPMPWPDAELACEAAGGHLVVIDGVQENLTALTIMTENSLFNPWIGLTDHASEDLFLWVSDVPAGYTNWDPGEPNNQGSWGGQEDCGQMLSTGMWNDVDCYANAPFICESDGVPPGSNYW